MDHVFTPKERRTFQNICHLTERGVLAMMADFLRTKYDNVISTPNYIMAIGTIPVALVAHADTVFKTVPSLENFFYDTEKNCIWNPDGMGADDRAGVFAILTVLRTTKLRPHVIITTGEEIGAIGAGKMIAHYPMFPADLNFMIQLDRRGMQDSVYYDCDNIDFEDYINQFGFTTNWGSFSDISVLAPMWRVAAVNLSIGYLDEHQEIERLFVGAMFDTIGKVIQILEDQQNKPQFFQYVEAAYSYYWRAGEESYASHCARAYAPGWDDEDDDFYGAWNNHSVVADPLPAVEPGKHNCTFCAKVGKEEDMIPLHFGSMSGSSEYKYWTCLDCFSNHANNIVFCNKCGHGYYLGSQTLKLIDPKTFICGDCKNESAEKVQSIGDSESSEQGAGVQSVGKRISFTHRRPYARMGNPQKLLH